MCKKSVPAVKRPSKTVGRLFVNLLVRRPIHRLKMSQCLSDVREPTPTPGFKNRPLTALVTKIQLQMLHSP